MRGPKIGNSQLHKKALKFEFLEKNDTEDDYLNSEFTYLKTFTKIKLI